MIDDVIAELDEKCRLKSSTNSIQKQMSKIGEEVDVTLKEYEDSSGLAALNKATNAITEPSNMVVNATLG